MPSSAYIYTHTHTHFSIYLIDLRKKYENNKYNFHKSTLIFWNFNYDFSNITIYTGFYKKNFIYIIVVVRVWYSHKRIISTFQVRPSHTPHGLQLEIKFRMQQNIKERRWRPMTLFAPIIRLRQSGINSNNVFVKHSHRLKL